MADLFGTCYWNPYANEHSLLYLHRDNTASPDFSVERVCALQMREILRLAEEGSLGPQKILEALPELRLTAVELDSLRLWCDAKADEVFNDYRIYSRAAHPKAQETLEAGEAWRSIAEMVKERAALGADH